jgi:hypothetical protein
MLAFIELLCASFVANLPSIYGTSKLILNRHNEADLTPRSSLLP